MRYLVLATDYDGTLATDGRVSDDIWDAVRRLRASGRKVFLVTGRELDDLKTVCSHLELFDTIVAENGGLLYYPGRREEKILAPAPPEDFVRACAPADCRSPSAVASWRPGGRTRSPC